MVGMMGRWGFLLFALLATRVFASSPPIAQEPLATYYTHTAWTQKDGAPAGIAGLSQGRDGWLWLATPSGLYRFDGKTFERRDPFSSDDVTSRNVVHIYAAPSGDVWLSLASGRVAVLRGGGDAPAQVIPLPVGHIIDTFLEDGDGRVFAFDNSSIFVLDHGRLVPLTASWQFDGADVTDAMTDAEGNIWVCTTKHLLELKKRAVRFIVDPHSDLVNGSIGLAADGRLWFNNGKTGFGYYPGSMPHKLPSTNGNDNVRIVDRFGAYWRAACPSGICRVTNPLAFQGSPEALSNAVIASRFDTGMSSSAAGGVMEDRDGNIWVATPGGIDRFRRNIAVQVPVPDAPAHFTLVAGNDGNVWMGTSSESTLRNYWWHLTDGSPERVGTFQKNISAALADNDGSILLSGEDGTWRFYQGVFTPLPSATGPFQGRTFSIARDGEGALWFVYRGQPLHKLLGTQWTIVGGLKAVRKTPPVTLATDVHGHLLMGYFDNAFSIVENGTVNTFGEQQGLQTGTVESILPGQPILVGGERGVAALIGNRFQSLKFDDPEAVRGISGMVRTPDGALWLNGSAGAVRVDGRDLLAALANPDRPVPMRVIGQGEGMPGAAQISLGHPTLVKGGDGRLWFASTGGLAWLDFRHLPVNHTPPPVHLTSVFADGKNVLRQGALNVPRDTHLLRFVFTAAVLGDADRARFRYRLSGVDSQWQNGGDRREADYSNLRPGKYVFQVIASNEDGVWNTIGATASVRIPAAFYQTAVFQFAVVAIALLLIFLAYRRHIDQVRRALVRQVVERHAERERIARELHDTIFQDMQALVLVVSATRDDASEPARESVGRAVDHAKLALTKGRERIDQLRALGEPKGDIHDLMDELISNLPENCATPVELLCKGKPWPVSIEVSEELRWIAREALLNASCHSGASAIRVEINFGWRNLRLVIADNGSGIPPDILGAGGKAGRWGLRGMHERAASVGAKLRIHSAPGTETRIVISLPRSGRMPSIRL